ncbi:hypothetical protein PspLS_06759 [Pyricularia sp. CBS 133598]|nr:hypothetical protein PspLS_06759 [Pyricularia sp. CBS 133598]
MSLLRNCASPRLFSRGAAEKKKAIGRWHGMQ